MATSMVFGPWCGGVTSSRAVVKAGLAANTSVSLLLSKTADGTGKPTSPQTIAPDSISESEMSVVAFELGGLTKDTQYFYALKPGTAIDPTTFGTFRTFPKEEKPATFSVVCAGDANTGSKHKVFDEIRGRNPLLFLHVGDLHYNDTNSMKLKDYRRNYGRVFKSGPQAALYRSTPINYLWDDHDFCGNGSDAETIGRTAVRLAYRQCVPHYELPADAKHPERGGDNAAYHAFTIGRVRFLVLDTRSERFPSTGSMLGAEQKRWLLDELLAAKSTFALTVIQSSVPWLGEPESGDERWWNYPKERDEIGTFITTNGITNVCMISGDSHMLAIDDGSKNTTFKKDGKTIKNGVGEFPSLVAAPLDRTNSARGGTYSHGKFDAHRGQYVVMTVVDGGGPKVNVIWEGRSQETGTAIVSHAFQSPR